MDAAARAVENMEGRGERSTLRLRRAPVADPVDSVVDTFLGNGATVEQPARGSVKENECGDASCHACGAEAEFKPLRLRCPQASAVLIGVEPNGRVCLEAQVGAGVSVKQVLGELEEAEHWLRASAHETAMRSVVARMDMSHPVRRRLLVDDPGLPVGRLTRAGIEVRGVK